MNKRTAFTMIELIYVIVVIGILAMIAIPRMGTAIVQANIGKAKSDVAAIRSAIASERQARFLKGSSAYISSLDKHAAATPGTGVDLFDDNDSNGTNGKLLVYPIKSGSNEGQWMKTGTNTYAFSSTVNDGSLASANFIYNSATGTFDCNSTGADNNATLCKQILN